MCLKLNKRLSCGRRDKSKVTYIGPGGDRKILTHMASKVSGFNLKLGAIYFSRDRLLFLSTFNCTAYKALDTNNQRIKEKIKDAKELMLEEFQIVKILSIIIWIIWITI